MNFRMNKDEKEWFSKNFGNFIDWIKFKIEDISDFIDYLFYEHSGKLLLLATVVLATVVLVGLPYLLTSKQNSDKKARFEYFEEVKVENKIGLIKIVRDKETGVLYFLDTERRITCPVYDENGKVKVVK